MILSSVFAFLATVLAILFLFLWVRERRRVSQAEIVAYGLRAHDGGDENTKTNISVLESEYDAAINRLSELGEIHKDNWGRWVWSHSGEQLGGS